MRRLDASIITLRPTSLRSGWLAAASTMPARITMNSLRAMYSGVAVTAHSCWAVGG
jgi:hypothetical protein